MIHVLLDTTTYTSDRKRQKGPFRALERLCKGDKVQLHIPYFVKNEYISQQFIDVRSHLAKIRDFAEDIRAITSEDGLHGFASEVKDKAIEMRDGAIDALTKEFEEWMDELGGEEHAVRVNRPAVNLKQDGMHAGSPEADRRTPGSRLS